MMDEKHAYLIMAYNNWNLLEKLLRLLDDERNDVFLHVDSKSSDFEKSRFENVLKKSRFFLIPRKPVYWADFSQIDVELNLMSVAKEKGNYCRYHLLSGTDLPLKTQDEIHEFFDKYADKEFIGIVPDEVWYSVRRLKFYHLMTHNNIYRNSKILKGADRMFEYLQRLVGVNRLKDCQKMKILDGWTWFSITDRFCSYLLNNRSFIEKTFRYSIASDELMCQTMAYNSEFRDLIYDQTNLKNGSMRFIDWKRGSPYTWGQDEGDYEMLMSSPYMFARKFNEDELSDRIYNEIRQRQNG